MGETNVGMADGEIAMIRAFDWVCKKDATAPRRHLWAKVFGLTVVLEVWFGAAGYDPLAGKLLHWCFWRVW